MMTERGTKLMASEAELYHLILASSLFTFAVLLICWPSSFLGFSLESYICSVVHSTLESIYLSIYTLVCMLGTGSLVYPHSLILCGLQIICSLSL
jgi:hypothetical protein